MLGRYLKYFIEKKSQNLPISGETPPQTSRTANVFYSSLVLRQVLFASWLLRVREANEAPVNSDIWVASTTFKQL